MSHPPLPPPTKDVKIRRFESHFTVTRGDEYQPFKDSRALDQLLFAGFVAEEWRKRAERWHIVFLRRYFLNGRLYRPGARETGHRVIQKRIECEDNAVAWRQWGEPWKQWGEQKP